ncbi:hypothetical protein MKEN_00160300 [Mycena kentingensis (nom. inval.)]|nr:hypothetical protein MKEN_00160300 [Mycena kentingensis (nom. inval.)]
MSHDLPLGLLSLYQPLTEHQREQASTLLRASLDEEAALEHEIDELSIVLQTLHDLLSEQKRESRVLAHVLAPIRRIPAEILAEIFATCVLLEQADPDRDEYASDSRWAPLRLAQVSSEWRSVAFASPQLWTEPVFQAFEPDRVLQMYLTNSGALPLDVRVYGGKPQRGSGTFPYLLRSERFVAGVQSLFLSREATTPYIPVTFQPRFAQLTALTLDFRDSGRPETSTCSRALGFFSNAAFLETLHLRFGSYFNHNPAADYLPFAPTFPWDNIKRLRVTTDAPDLVLDILRRCCRNLEQCVLDGMASFMPTEPRAPVRLPALRNFEISGGHIKIVRFLHAPALQRLVVSTHNWSSSSMEYFRAQSGFNLDHLSLLHLSAASGHRVLLFLRACSSIESLSLSAVDDGPCDAEMLKRLRWRTDSGAANANANILPNLRTIRCPGVADLNLLEVVLSRVRPTAEDVEGGEQRSILERVFLGRWVDVPSNASSRMAEVLQYLIRRGVLHCGERRVVAGVAVRAHRL